MARIQNGRCTKTECINQWRTVGQRIGGGGGGAPSGKVCVVTSVASFLVLGGGARPPNVPTKNVHFYTERSERAPQKHIFSGFKIPLPT